VQATLARALLEDCWHLNLVNGSLIETNRAFTESLLGLYTAARGTGSSGVYGASGALTPTSHQEIIAKT
jgi:flagellar biosynthesis/type III secretory pathway chaperone